MQKVCVPKIVFRKMQKVCVPKTGFRRMQKVCVPKTGFRGAKKVCVPKTGFRGPPDHLQEEIMGNWARPPNVEIVEIMEIEKIGNFQTQFSLLNFDYFLVKFASKIAFGRRELKKVIASKFVDHQTTAKKKS